MDTARIAALLEPFLDRALPEAALQQTLMYINLLLRWNARVNLTAIRDPEQIVARHFGESFFLARHLFPGDEHAGPGLTGSESPVAPRVFDLGSGAGFPGLPLKIFAPGISLTLVESNHRKAAFLREAVRALTLTDVNVSSERAETLAVRLGPSFPPADIVTLRAVERFGSVLPLATRFLAPSGRLALLIGSVQLPSLSTLAPTLNWLPAVPLPQSQSRVMSIGILR